MDGASLLVAADIKTSTERRIVETWASREHPGAAVHSLDDPTFSQAVDAAEKILPVRVTWLPQEQRKRDRLNFGELVLLAQPRRPWKPLQEAMTRWRPDAITVTTGTPASTDDLRDRYVNRYSGDGQDGAPSRFAQFVARQAILACDRAERSVVGNRYKVPKLIADQLLESPSFKEGLKELSERLGRKVEDLREEAFNSLEELVAVQSPVAIEIFRTVLRPMHVKAWEVEADTAALDALKETNRTHSLIFLPSHRSYVDPLILADVLWEHDLPRNHTLGGANLSFWPMGPLGKRAGIVFIRRSFGGDEVYKFAVRRYLAHLMAKRFNLEWFMEGGRTRTGKLRSPKYGILRYLVDGLQAAPEADPVIVPVSIVYEQLHEVTTMAEEELGSAKQAEGLAWMARYMRAQQGHLGRVLVRFGEPLKLREALDNAGEGRAQLEKVAFEVATRINDVTPATSTSLVTFVLLGERDRALTMTQITRRITPLLDYLDDRGIERPKDDLRHASGIVATLDRLEDAGVVECYRGGPTPVWQITDGRNHTAAFYRNGALHHLLHRAIVETVLPYVVALPDGVDHLEEAFEEALRLRDLLKFEFFFPPKREYREQLERELQMMSPNWNGTDARPDQAGRVITRALQRAADGTSTAPAGPLVAHHVLRSFIDAQLVAAEVMVDVGGGTSITRDQLVERCLALGHQMLRQRRVHGGESISRELFGGCARLAANRNLLEGGAEAQKGRETYRDELVDIINRLEHIADLEADVRRTTEVTPNG